MVGETALDAVHDHASYPYLHRPEKLDTIADLGAMKVVEDKIND